ncbi:MAG: hypothetical protein M3Y13_06285, partial [Armatimonadota bacterium]|nr:hypothetical protein [Armatimonadota bacterium]
FNSAGAVMAKGWVSESLYEVSLRAGGRFLAWAARCPERVQCGGEAVEFAYDEKGKTLEATIPQTGAPVLRVFFGESPT